MDGGWQHCCLDYDPATDGDEEQWARAVKAAGWRTYAATGIWGHHRQPAGAQVGAAPPLHQALVGSRPRGEVQAGDVVIPT